MCKEPKGGDFWTGRYCKVNLKPLETKFEEKTEGKLRVKGRSVRPLKYLAPTKLRDTNVLSILHDSSTYYCTEREEPHKTDENKVTDTLVSTQIKNECEAIKMLEAVLITSKVSFDGKNQEISSCSCRK